LTSGIPLAYTQEIPAKSKPVSDNEQVKNEHLPGDEKEAKLVGEETGNSPLIQEGEKEKESGKDNSEVKKVKGSNLDMSKSRGARPPTIVRPSGSRTPLGAGKPKGAGRPGKR